MPSPTPRLSGERTKTDGPRPFHYASLLLLLLGAACLATGFTPFTSRAAGTGGPSNSPSGRALSLQERVAHQRAVEEVYWRHTEWPAHNQTPKPSLDEVVPLGATRAKVEDSLRKSEALARLWDAPVTGEQLQAEVARMARETRRPGVLRELWSALGNDPFLVAEVLARPALADRRVRSLYSLDERFHGPLRERAAAELSRHATLDALGRAGASYREFQLVKTEEKAAAAGRAKAGVVELQAEEWDAERARLAEAFGATSCEGCEAEAEGLPVGVVSGLQESADGFYATSVLASTGTTLKVARVEWSKVSFDSWWSGESASYATVAAPADDFSYQLAEVNAAGADDTWTPTRTLPTNTGTAVWTGAEVIIWGGSSLGARSDKGARYNPATDTWTSTSTVGAPRVRAEHTAVWTGTEMLVWGGCDQSSSFCGLNSGGRYNPQTDSWTPTSATNAPAGRRFHTAVWTGSKMVVWGGCSPGYNNACSSTLVHNSGGVYDPANDTWRATTLTSAPTARQGHRAVWTGTEMLVWGSSNTGGRYNPDTDTWRPTNTFNAPAARAGFTMVWAGREAVVWGGYEGNTITLNTGGRYNPATDSWTPTSTLNTPDSRFGHTAVWTGTEMLVYGGDSRPTGSPDKLVNTGGRYNPQTDSWTPTSTTNAPLKNNHVAVWTGSEMFVWGGNHFSSTVFREAARYRPSTDSWVPTSNPVPPQAAELGVWSGAELFVLGKEPGCNSVCRSVGGRYDPATNSWRSLNFAGAPAGDYVEGAAAVWTGREMILWGAGTAAGARYDPLADAWTRASEANAPAGKRHATAVWTGSEMLVWGGDNNPEGVVTPGGRYDPQTDSWQLMSLTGGPAARSMHTAVWTGSEMVVWGGSGYFAGSQTNSGGRYNPQTDSWQPTSTTGAPEARLYNTGVWTGSEMVVWGGWVYSNEGSRYLNTGGRYNPQTDTWQPTSTAGAPGARSHHRAVWTGSLMVVWGGLVPVTWTSTGDPTHTGARYNPASDSWTPTSLQGAPSRRDSHVQVWTGTQMIVWGGRGPGGINGALQDGAIYNAPGSTHGNTPPTVRMTAPASGAAFQSGDTVRMSVETADADGTVASVRFYANDALVGTAVQAPFHFDWREVRGGSYSLLATAVDNAGGEGRSTPINITVAPSTEPPVCSLTAPVDGSNYAYGAYVRLEATATANRDRSIARVEFLVDGRVVTSQAPPSYNPPWSHSYQANEAGARSLAVRCTDNAGAVTASSARTIHVAASGYTVSGQVLDARGFAIAGVRVRLDGPAGTEPRYVTTTTVGNGNYFFTDLKPGESYKVTPEPGEWRFSPESSSYPSISKDWPGQNFVGTRAGYGISGHLRDAGGHPIYPATVNLSGSKVASTGTDVNGYYFFSNLTPGGTYTLQPYKNLYSFQPGFRTFENLSAEQTADFTATPQTTTHTVAGRVVDDKGAPVSNLRIRLDTVRVSSTQYRTTDADGRYSFGAITAGETCSVFPEDFTYAYGFTPHFARSYQALAQDVTNADFVATPRTVGGRVTQSGSGLGGVTVKLEGPQGATATTGADGAFVFRGVTMRGDYTVTATKAGYALTPTQHTIKDLKEDATLGFSAAVKPPPLVQFGAVSSAADERAGSAAFTVTRTGDTSLAVSVSYATSGGTAAAGPDYTAASGTLHFAAGETQKTLNIALNDDALDEADETVFLTLSNPSGGATLGEQITATLTITDNDAPPSLSVSDANVVEGHTGNAVATFTVTLSAPSGRTVTVVATTADGTAAAGSDYAAGSATLIFAPGETSKTFAVQVLGDTAFEPDENFFVNLSAASGATTGDTQGQGVILNDEALSIFQFSAPHFSVGEAGSAATVTVTRLGSTAAGASVNYATSDATATAGSDYTATSGTLIFASGETGKTFNVAVNNDTLDESDEALTLTLTSPTGGSVGGGTAVLHIGDNDDPPTFQFSGAAYGVTEGNVATIIVTRAGGTNAAAVNYATSGGTAAAGPDYTAASGTLDFAEGETSKTFNVAALEDALDEPNETIGLSLSGAAGTTLGSPNAAVLTITDNDGTPTLSIADTSMVEGPGTADFTVTLSAPSGQTVTVSYATANNTAAAPGDYTAATGTLTFAPGDTSKTVNVNVNGDTQDEPDETFFVNLSGATNATVLDAQGVAVISNDDAPRLQFAQAVFPAAESAHYQTITVTRAGDATAPLTVNYTTQDGTASRLSDYTAAVGALEFAAGETSKTFDVLLTDDGHREGEETIRLVLTNPSVGASLGGQATADVLIGASDDPPPASNPADESATFVRQHYHDFFSRKPDAPGLAHWTSVVESCGQDAMCREVSRINTSGAFFLSIEFKETGYLVERIYKAAYGDATGTSTLGGTHQLQVPIIRLEEFLPDTQRIGRGVVVHAPGWEAQLEANKTAFTREFVQRERFLSAFPLSLSPAEFVNRLDERAGRVLGEDERGALINELTADNTAAGRASVLRKVAEDPTLEAAERNRAFVLMQYFGYLRRDPNMGQDMDYTGYDFWLRNLEKAGGNFVQAELVKAFIQSIEYRGRFGQ